MRNIKIWDRGNGEIIQASAEWQKKIQAERFSCGISRKTNEELRCF